MDTSKPIRILLVDDYAVVRAGLRALIATESEMMVVGEAADAAAAVRQAKQLQPDIIILDLVMPGQDGLTVVQAVKRQVPSTRVLVLTNFADQEYVLPILEAGVHGYMLKDAAATELLDAIHQVYRGRTVVHPTVRYIWQNYCPAPG